MGTQSMGTGSLSVIRLFFLLLGYFGWVATCAWAERDARKVGAESSLASLLLVGSGLAGMAFLWLVPWFWLGWLIYATMIGAAAFLYVHYRNQQVEASERILTADHCRSLLNQYLHLELSTREEMEDAKPPPTVRFLGRGSDPEREIDEDESRRLQKLQESKGYQRALELVQEAIEKRASDIHLEPARSETAVRLRVDGVLTTVVPFTRAMGDAVVNIFKVLSLMDITEKRKPQDGSFSAQINAQTVDFRVASAGSVNGEKLVLRILDKTQQLTKLSQLGMRDKMSEQIRQLLGRPHGMLLVCGPTGSGKSTTLYACLHEIDCYQKNIITIENPVEYQLANVTQIEVNPKAGKTFASELRSILRQDPDIIMIGEIRDQETAAIACQAAQTGHLVLSTMHANDTVTALGRLIDLGVQPFMVASAVSAVLCQRLVRQLCPACKVRYKPNPELLRKANLPVDKIKFFYRPPDVAEIRAEDQEPCPTCGGTGYFKRVGLFEYLTITDKIRELIREKPDLNAIRQEAVKEGMHYLYEDGLRKVLEGDTSIQELLRASS